MPKAPHLPQPRMAAWVLAGTLAAWGADARADEAARVTILGPVPFSSEELEQSIAARLPATAPWRAPERLIVGPAAPSGIVVRMGERTYSVAVGDRRGAPAARVVALVVTDLMLQEIAPPQAAPLTERRAAADPAPARAPLALRLTAVGGASKGAGGEEPYAVAVDADATLLVRQLVLGLMLGGTWIPQRHAGLPDEVAYAEAVARVVAGWRYESFEILAGPSASPYTLRGAVQRTGVLFGAGAIGRVAPRLAGRLRLVVSLRVDVHANRLHASWTTGGGFATPWWNTAGEIGLAWDFGA